MQRGGDGRGGRSGDDRDTARGGGRDEKFKKRSFGGWRQNISAVRNRTAINKYTHVDVLTS